MLDDQFVYFFACDDIGGTHSTGASLSFGWIVSVASLGVVKQDLFSFLSCGCLISFANILVIIFVHIWPIGFALGKREQRYQVAIRNLSIASRIRIVSER